MKPANFKKAQTHYQFVLGPIKIKDGLFMGDELAAKDIEFIISNKVTHIVNTVSKIIPNLWQRFGIQYLSVNWTQKQQNIFDKKNNAVNAIFHFIQEAMEQGQSCLIHSVHGKSRSCAVMVAYLIKKYNWTLDKCFEYITSKKDHLEVRDNYLSQMQQLQKRMMQLHNLTGSWQDCKSQEELILRNTYQNSKVVECGPRQQSKNSKRRITWGEKSVIQPKTLANTSSNMSATMNRFKQAVQKKSQSKSNLKSILKGEPNQDEVQEDLNEQKLISTDTFPIKKDNNFISTINGNIVHVTVNNFITTDKKVDRLQDKTHLTRPYSSDNKQRQQRDLKNPKIEPKKNLFTYDPSFKSPYDTKLASKLGSNPKIMKKKEEIRNPMIVYERPQSANIAAQRRKINNSSGKPIGQYFQKKEEMSIIGKKRYPSNNPRDQLYKWK